MAATTPTSPPLQSPARPVQPGAFALFFAAAPTQIGRAMTSLAVRVALPFRERRLRMACRALGREMHRAAVGDQILRERVTQLTAPTTPRDEAQIALAEESLGRSALGLEVPIIGAESPFLEAKRIHDACRRSYDTLARNSERAWPATALGWLQLGSSYLFLTAFVSAALALVIPTVREATPSPQQHMADRTGGGAPGLSARVGDVDVRVLSARVGYDRQFEGEQRDRPVPHNVEYFVIEIEVRDLGASPVRYTTWRTKSRQVRRDFATLVDSHGLDRPQFVSPSDQLVPAGGVADATIQPGQAIKDVLVFLPPSERSTHADLFLPAGNVGGTDTATIRIPRSMFAPAEPGSPNP